MQIEEFLGVLFRQVLGLAEVLGEVVKRPGILIGIGRRAQGFPGFPKWHGAGHPAVVEDRAVGRHLEVLGRVPRWDLRVVERVDHADAFHRLLRYAVEQPWGLNVGGLQDRRHDVNDVVELGSHFTAGLDPLRPANGQPVPRAAQVRRDLLGPLKRGIHRVGPANRVVVVSLIAAQFVDH